MSKVNIKFKDLIKRLSQESIPRISLGCGLIVAKTRDGEIKCGEEMWGQKRYCAYCQNLINNSHKN